MKLKDGSETNDSRLTRLIDFDQKSKDYPIRELMDGEKKLRSYTWRCLEHLNQGPDGACVGFSMVHELIARPSEIKGLDAKFAKEKVYWEAQKIDPWDGGSYPSAFPQYEGTSILAGMKILKREGYIDEYRWAFSLEDLIWAIGHKGPAIIGINWYESMFEPYTCGQLHAEGNIVGGHAILCKGVSITKKTFTLHNSWGQSWADNGDVYISWDEMEKLLYENGEAAIPLIRNKL